MRSVALARAEVPIKTDVLYVLFMHDAVEIFLYSQTYQISLMR